MPTPEEHLKSSRWAGLPTSERVAERRSLLLDAALELLGTEGWAGTSVRAICHSARLNPRYFYESFAELDDLVVALYDRLIAELHAEVSAAVEAADDDPRGALRAVVATTVRFVDEDHRRARVLYVEALGNEKLNRRRLETGSTIAGYVRADSAKRDRRAPGSDRIGVITASIFVGGFSELLMTWLNGDIDVSRDQLADHATELFATLHGTAKTISHRERE